MEGKQSFVHMATKICVDVLFYISILCTLGSYVLSGIISGYFGYENKMLLPITIFLSVSGILASYIMFNIKKIFKSLVSGNPFIWENVSCFRKMAVACALICVVYFTKCFVMFSIATVAIILVFGFGCLFCLTIKDVFKQAIIYKEEQDWTV